MTVSTLTNSVIYTGNGSATAFAVPFKVLDVDHLLIKRRVIATGVDEHTYIGTEFSYSGIGADAGTITLSGTALSSAYQLVIERIVPYTQELDIVNAGGFYPETVEDQLDLMVMAEQQLATQMARAIFVPDGENGLTLPSAAARANTFLGFDNNGNLTTGSLVVTTASGQSVSTRTLLAAVTGATAGVTRVTLTESGREGDFEAVTTDAAAVASDPGQGIYIAGIGVTWRRVNRSILNAKWFGAVGDNATVNTTTLQQLLTYAAGLNAAKIFIPQGQYVFANLTLPVYSGPQKVIEIIGEQQPGTMFGTVGTSAMPTWGTILRGTSTTNAIFKVLSSGGAFSNYHLVLRDLIFRTYDNPQVAGIDASKCSQISFYNLMVETGVYNMQASLPTHNAAIGVMTPLVGNGALSRLDNVAVGGYYFGIDVGEHIDGEYLNLSSCLYALLFEQSNDSIYFGRVAAQCCPHVIAVNSTCAFDIAQLMIEDVSATQAAAPATSWMAPDIHFIDVGNAAKATIKVRPFVGDVFTVQPLSTLKWSGGSGIHIAPVGQSWENPGFHTTATTSIPSNLATDTKVAFSTGSAGDSGLQIDTDTTHLKCVVPGLYELTFRGDYAANATGSRRLLLSVNGSLSDLDYRAAMGSSLDTTLFVRGLVRLAIGDYITLAGSQDSASGLNLNSGTLFHKRIAANFVP